jgi:hypothetical protein
MKGCRPRLGRSQTGSGPACWPKRALRLGAGGPTEVAGPRGRWGPATGSENRGWEFVGSRLKATSLVDAR